MWSAMRGDKEYIMNLWTSFLNGKEEPFRELYEITFEPLLNYGLHICKEREIVEDCIQDVFVKLYVREIKPDEPAKIRAFIYKVLKNSLLNVLIRNSKSQSIDTDQNIFHLSYTIEEDLFADADMRIRLEALLAALSEREKEIIYLRYIRDMKIEEIALIQNMNVQSVRNSLCRSMNKVRKDHAIPTVIFIGLLFKLCVK